MKPANVLVFNVPSDECKGVVKYNLKIADFGLAKKRGEKSSGAGQEYKYRGTLPYNSPESVVFGVHEAPMDIWSVGCIVLEMLLGEGGLWKNYLDEDAQSLAEMIANYEDDRLKYLLPELDNLSVFAKDFVKRCLTKRVEDRWTADELVTHPFITHNQSMLKKFEAQLAYKKLMQFRANTPFNPSFGPSQGIKKEPGCCSIQMYGVSYEFFVGDTSHIGTKEIYKLLDIIDKGAEAIGVYAVASGWNEVGLIRKWMTDKGVKKEPGCYSIEMYDVLHEFFAGNTSHSSTKEIYKLLDVIAKRLEAIGFL
ncbi:hypothetical protein AgCh_013714 [Apium graveolens]